MRFIRKNGRIIPIGDNNSGQKRIGSGQKATSANVYDDAKSIPRKESSEKISRTFSQKVSSKLNGFMNKFKTIDSGKMQSAYMFQNGKNIGNKVGANVTFGANREIFKKQAIKSTSRLQRISKLMAKNKTAKARGSLVALSVIAGAGAYGYLKSKKSEGTSI